MWRAVGIEGVEESVYRAWIRDPDGSVADCAEALGITPQRCRTAIGRLVDAGLLEREGRRLRPVDPRAALGTLVRARQSELDRLAADVDQLATDFYRGRLRADPGLVLRVLEGQAAIGSRFRDLLGSAERDIVGLDAPPYVIDADHGGDLERSVLTRGVRFRSLYAADVLNHPAKVAHTDTMVEAGEQARLLRTVPLKLLAVDRHTALLPLTGSEAGSRFRAVEVQRSALTDALYALFEVLWRQATPWPTRGRGASPGLTDDEQALLRYLMSGMKDEAIARQLACSRRTLRRRVDALLDRLGATSRFQAGALAVHRGWL